MRTGTAVVDITPEAGVELSGYGARVQPSVGVHDRLFARYLYLEDDANRLLWIHADLLAFERDFVVGLKQQIGERFGFAPHQIVISATHTHSGPATVHLFGCGEYEAGYVEWLGSRLLEGAADALEDAEETQAVHAEGHCDLAVDRRGKASAHTDHRVGVLAWRRADGTYAAVLANYAMHNVGLSSDNRLVSADMAGRAARTASESLPGSPVVLFTNGACGNTNPPELTTDFAKVEAMGDQMAASVVKALDHAMPLPNTAFRTAVETLDVPLDTMDVDQVTARADALRDEVKGRDGYVADRIRSAADAWQGLMLRRAEEGTPLTHVPMDIHAIRLGGVSLVCLGAEVFSRMADELRAAAGKTVYVVGYANGDIGYLPTPEAYAEGGYEVDNAFIFYGSFRPKPSAFDLVRDTATRLLQSV